MLYTQGVALGYVLLPLQGVLLKLLTHPPPTIRIITSCPPVDACIVCCRDRSRLSLDVYVSATLCAYRCYTRLLWILPFCVSLRYSVIHSFPQGVDKHCACKLLITCLYTGLYTVFVENYSLYISLLY